MSHGPVSPYTLYVVSCLLGQSHRQISGAKWSYLFAVKYSVGKPIQSRAWNFIRNLLLYGFAHWIFHKRTVICSFQYYYDWVSRTAKVASQDRESSSRSESENCKIGQKTSRLSCPKLIAWDLLLLAVKTCFDLGLLLSVYSFFFTIWAIQLQHMSTTSGRYSG